MYNLSNYADINKVINDNGYRIEKKLIVKKKDNLYLIKYNKKELTISNESTLGLFRSVITDGKKILSFAPPKSINFDFFCQTNSFDSCVIEEFVEGTMINLFWNPTTDDWNIATRSNIGANCKYNMSSQKTFRYMFLDAMNRQQLEFDMFDKKNCYSFVLQHPENRIVLPINEPKIVLTNVFRCETKDDQHIVKKLNQDDFLIPFDEQYPGGKYKLSTPLIIKSNEVNSWESLIDYYSSDNLDYKIQGVIIYSDYGNGANRSKFRSKNYEMVKNLKGNTPKLQYQYLHLRQTNKVRDFLKYYPEYKEDFSNLRNEIHDYTNQLYKNYIDCYIHKTKSVKEYPYNFKTHMFNLHKLYLDELKQQKKYVSKAVVVSYVNSLHPARAMYSINYKYNKHKLEVDKSDRLYKSSAQ